MRTSRTRQARRAVLGAVAACALAASAGPAGGQSSLFDPRFEEVRRASVVWDRRNGPPREVVDVVCLVPDEAAFFEALATWDAGHYFPILIDDVETTLKFLRAFRPARVVRFPGKEPAPAAAPAWERAITAVGKAWADDAAPAGALPRGDAVPASLGATPPGVVVATAGSPSLAGAAALAAGRFQPLLKWETAGRFNDRQTLAEARALALDLETRLAERFPRYDRLGDDCDFVTLAGDYPYRYDEDGQAQAFDDLILRSAETRRRWAFAGRLTGDATHSVYRAMCGLFLHPPSALLFNGYAQTGPPWTEYAMGGAESRLAVRMGVTERAGDRAGLAGWHQAFDPVNPFGLLLLNTSGGPTDFHLAGGPGHTADVPESGAAAVLMIHSFSAAAPDDPNTLAGRWLANGAYVYYGSMNEPYLQAFRPPALVASFLAENLPVVASVRQSSSEPYGRPWRLAFLGDPLFRIRPVSASPRLAAWAEVDGWPAYGELREPGRASPDDLRLTWALRTAVFRTQTGATPRLRADLSDALLAVARDRLEPALLPVYDALIADTLPAAGRSSELIERLARVPPAGRSADLRRHLETAQLSALQRAADLGDQRQAIALWDDVIKDPNAGEFGRVFTDRVGRLADSPDRLTRWRDALGPGAPNRPVVEAERKRVDERRKAAPGGRP